MKKEKVFITIITGSLRRGGAEIQLSEILPGLDKNKYKVEIFLLSTRGELANEMESKGISIINPWFDTKGETLNIPTRLYRYFVLKIQLFIYFIRKRPDIVHFFLPQSYCLAMPIAIITGINKKIMSRLSLNNYKLDRVWMWKLEKFLHSFTTKIVVNSDFVKKQMIDDENVSNEKIIRIYSGIKLDGFDLDRKQELREKLGLSSEQLILVMVANLIPYKGHADLISALGLISDEMPKDWKMIFIGRDDGIKTALIDQTKKYNISENCEFLHPKGDITDYYAIADIGILSSHEEGFSIAILEGMRAALPMVVTNVGGNSESVLDGKTGFVVPAQDCQKISEAILKLCLDKELRQSMGQSANQRVKDNFSIENCINEHHVLYSNLI